MSLSTFFFSIGTKEAVAKAKEDLDKRIKELDNIIEDTMTVDPKHHKHFVARRGEVLRKIGDEFGGVVVSFPRAGVTSDRVNLKGARNCVDAAKARILDIVQDLEEQVTIDCEIPQQYHRYDHNDPLVPVATCAQATARVINLYLVTAAFTILHHRVKFDLCDKYIYSPLHSQCYTTGLS